MIPLQIRSFSLRVLASSLLCATAAMCQQVAPSIRIVDKIDESNLVTLKGNTHPAANAKNDLGKVSDGLPMTDLILVLSRAPAQQAAFDKFVASQYDSSSANFHQWLTPEQVGENFGPSDTDIATISNWLTGHGFTIGEVTKDHMSIRFSGTAGQVQSTFHTEIHNLQAKGVAHIGNMSDPQIPAALSPVVVGVKSLHNFFPRPEHHMGSVVSRDAATGLWKRVASSAATESARSAVASRPALGGASIGSPLAAGARTAEARPQFGSNPSSEGFTWLVEDLGPYDFGTIYNILPLWNAGIDGTGQKIAIAGTSDIDVGQTGETGANGNNDIATFRNFFGLPTNISANTPLRVSGNSQPPTVCTDTTGTVPFPSNPCTTDDLIENSLDVEWSGSIAKNAQIVLVASYPSSVSDDNLYDSESYIVNNIDTASSPVFGARIMNVSYGECELSNGTAGNVEYYDLWQTAASEGISVFVAAGDSGSASCDDGYTWAASGLTVSGLASTPWNTAVGGTDFNWCSPDTANGSADTECTAAPYWSTSNQTPPGGTQASYNALGYVPEVPWNESCANPLTLSWVQDAANYLYGIPSSGSGGITNVEQACNFIDDYDYSFGDPPGLQEDYPYLLNLVQVVGGSGGSSGCVVGSPVTNSSTGAITGCSVGASSTGATTNPDTSASQASLTVYPTATGSGWPKPSWQTGVSGIPSDGVRDLPDVSFFAADGYVSSSAYLICVSQEGACSYSSLTEPFAQEVGGTSVATPAMAGVMALIDQKVGAAQGLATPGLYALAAKQSQSGYASCSAETVKASSTSCYFNDIDEYNNAQPCDAYDATPNCTATSSTFGYADNSDENGLGILTGYSAGAGYDLATGLGSLNVANVVNAWTSVKGTAAATVTVTPANSSINSSNTLSVTVTVASTASEGATPTGTVTLTASGSTYSASSTSSTGSYSFTIPANSLPGSAAGELDTLTASYAGDGLYAATSNSAPVTVTTTMVAELMPTITVTPASATLNSGASLGVTVTVAGNGVIAPTGTVTLMSGSYTSGAQMLATSGSCTAAACSITIPANTLSGSSSGASDTITATYSGDGTYQSGSGTGTVTVTESAFSLTQTPITVSPTSIAPGSSSTVTVTVTPVAGYVGSITLTCSLQSTTAASGGDGASCTGGSTPVTISSSGTVSGSPIVFTISTTAPITASLVYPNVRGKGWMGAGGAVLAFLVFLGIPARRRSWRQMLGAVVLMVVLGTLAGCGGGSGGGGGGGQTDPGTLAGTYTFQVQATGTPSVSPAVSTTFTVTVN